MSKAKKKTETFAGFKIRYRADRDRYFIQVRRDGLKHSEMFATIEAARLKCQQLHNEQVQNGLNAFELDGPTRQDASEAVKVLSGRSTLLDAARFWAMHHPDAGATSYTDLVDQYLADLERRKCRPKSITDMRHRLTRFGVDYGDRAACTITQADVLQWLDVRGGGPVNQDNFRRAFRACFNFARKRGVVTVNPVEGIEAIRADAAEPEIWTAAQVESCLIAAQTFAPRMVPVLAVMAFAGLRPDEAARLDWSNVNLEERHIRVVSATSKRRRGRLVDMPDNLVAWLVPYYEKAGPIAPPPVTIARWRIKLAAVMVLGVDDVRRRMDQHEGMKGTEIKGLGLGWSATIKAARKKGARWPQDVLRHSYASHWLPVHNDQAKLAAMMGNSPDVIEQHYKAVVTPKEAQRYWNISPATEGGIIKFRAVA